MWNWKIEGYVFETPIVNEVFNNVFTVFDNRLVNEQFAKRDIDFKCMFKVLYVGLIWFDVISGFKTFLPCYGNFFTANR